MDSEIQSFSTKCRLKQITPSEAAIWVNKFLASNDINKPQKEIIITSLQFISETINQTTRAVVVVPPIEQAPIEKPKKRASRFSDAPPTLYSEANPSDESETSLTSSFSRNSMIQAKKSEAYYAISKLILELKENGYDMSLQQNLPNLLKDILQSNSVGANKLTLNELNLIKTDYGHLFPHVIKILDTNIATCLDPNNNSIPSSINSNT